MEKRKLYKGGAFLFTPIPAGDVFTPEEFTKEQKMVFKAAQDFVKNELAGNAELIEEKQEPQVRKWFRMIGELGLNAIDVPETYGGEGMDKISACLVTEAMGAGHSFSVAHTCQTGIGSLPILLFGTHEQKQKYIPRLASGEIIGAYCLTESGAGSDALNAQTTARLSEDGRHYLLNGEKIFITNGAWADVLTVFAKVDGDKFTGFIVERGFPGFSTGAEEKKLGIKGSSTVSVILKDCRVPVENVLFEVGQGHKIAFNVLNIGRYKLGPATVGAMKASLAQAAKYATEREQFGKKIAEFGLIRDKLAQMAVGIYIAETASYRLAAAIQDQLDTLHSQQEISGADISRAIEEYSMECALVKIAGSEWLDYVVDEYVQIYGGNGYIAEYPAERAYRDSRINRIFEGTNEINRIVAAGTLLKRALAGRIDLMGAIKALPAVDPGAQTAPLDAEKPLARQQQLLTACKQLFLRTVEAAAAKLMANMDGEQEILGLLAEMMLQVYLMEGGLLRAVKTAGSTGGQKAEFHVAAARVYLARTLPEMLSRARQIVSYVGDGAVRADLHKQIQWLSAFPQEDIITLKRQIADRVVKSKKYPLG
ncbi:MAG: acyl-CoA dehydrogenase family protein [Thermodesulfobacteriota bacterium]